MNAIAPAGAAELAEWAGRKRARASSPNTRRAYEAHWRAFDAWCLSQGLIALPATGEVLVAYLRELEQHTALAASSVSVRLAAIQHAHRLARQPSPMADPRAVEVWEGYQREHARAPSQAWALEAGDVKRMLEQCPADLGGDRDAALLLVGFVGGFRRSELAALDVEDIQWHERGAIVTLRRSKTNAAGRLEVKAIPYLSPATCPARHLRAYLEAARIDSGAVFRAVGRDGWSLRSERLSGGSVARVVKKLAAAAGLDATHYSGHSLRSGFLTTANRGRASTASMMRQTGHRRIETALEYIRNRDPFDDCAAYALGL